MNGKGFFTVPELMERYGIGSAAVRSAIRSGELPALKFGRRYVVPIMALREYETRLGMLAAEKREQNERQHEIG